MFKKKKKETEEQFTPLDLQKLGDKNTKDRSREVPGRFGARRSAQELTKTQKRQRRAFWLLISLLFTLLIMYLLSMFLTQWGDLVISVDRDAYGKGIAVSELGDLSDTSAQLSGNNVKEVTNITYDWLPFDELDKKDGSYNGKNHLAYTFYLTNNGTVPVTVEGVLSIAGVSKSMDEAVRVMVYKNGEPAIYAKKQYQGEEPEPDTTVFVDDKTIMTTVTENLQPGQSDKYTIVSWVEGNDPECIDDIMGGYMRMSMLFGIADDEE